MSPLEPQSAAGYDDRSTQAVKSVLLEMGQILGSYKGKFVVVGGLIPWLLQNNEDMPHVGTLDLDLGLDPSALADGEYASLIESSDPEGQEGYLYIDGKFTSFDDYGPTCVRKFVEETDVLQERSSEQWQQDAFGVVDQWLKLLGLREA